jgi:outer membrane lipoprotein-sorting protein
MRLNIRGTAGGLGLPPGKRGVFVTHFVIPTRRCLVVFLFLLLLPSSGFARETVDEIRGCMEQNVPERASIQEVVMRTFDRVGGERSFEAKVYWKRGEEGMSKLLLRVEAPPDLRGAAYLALEREGGVDMFSYLPELQRVRGINARSVSGSLFGTDFTYEDFQRLQDFGARSTVERLPDAEVDGRSVHVLAARPDEGSGSAYERIVSFVDQETCVLLQAEFFEGGKEPRRRLIADNSSLSRHGEIWVAQKLTMKDLRDGGETRLELNKIELDPEIPDRRFSQARLGRRR